ncbi:MAG: multiprotein bridging factor aMBF1 [Candidatus Anstonellales archaeon]
MTECEMCGGEGAGYLILVEGAKLFVCQQCSTLGKILSRPSVERREKNTFQPAPKTEVEIVDDYAKRIREAREKMGLSVSVVAERINEKESFLKKIESGSALPPQKLARKLERELSIKLLEEVTESVTLSKNSKSVDEGVTLWDIFEKDKKRKEGGQF